MLTKAHQMVVLAGFFVPLSDRERSLEAGNGGRNCLVRGLYDRDAEVWALLGADKTLGLCPIILEDCP